MRFLILSLCLFSHNLYGLSLNDLNFKSIDFLLHEKGSNISMQKLKLGELTSNKPIIIDFWATWCNKCMAKINDLNALQKELGDKFNYIAINAGESPKALKKFKKKLLKKRLKNHNGLTNFLSSYQIIWDKDRQHSKSFFKVEELPQLLLFNKKGGLIYRAKQDGDFKTLVEKAKKL